MKAVFNKSQVFQRAQTVNGKLVLPDTDDLENAASLIAGLIQQVQHLETEIIAAEQLDRKEYINQLKMLKLSVQNLERLYRKLLFSCLAPVALLTVLCLSVAYADRAEPNKSRAGAAAIVPASSPDLIEPPS